MSTDIVERLRTWDKWDPPIGFDERKGHVAPAPVPSGEAADEIERLRSLLTEKEALLKEAGEELEEVCGEYEAYEWNPLTQKADKPLFDGAIVRRARAVLSKIKGE